MTQGLIGHTGFVGTTLQRQTTFAERFRSTDIHTLRGRAYDTLVVAGAPATKWRANQAPEADWAAVSNLIEHLRHARAQICILISTVDVFADPCCVDESSQTLTDQLQPYGLHRLRLEEAVQRHFARHLIVRLPGLVGPGLRKNALYDLKHGHRLAALDGRGRFQFYPMVNLWHDIQQALRANLSCVHLTAEPVQVQDVAAGCFGIQLTDPPVSAAPAHYDMRTCHAALLGGQGAYTYTARESLLAIRAYAQGQEQEQAS